MVTSRLRPCDNLRQEKSVAKGSGMGSNNQTRLFEEQALIKKREERGNNPRGHGRDDDESIKLDLLEKEVERREKKPKLSAYICFSLWIQFRLAKKLGPDASADDIASQIEKYWKHMTKEDRCSWEKARFIRPSTIDAPAQNMSETLNVTKSQPEPAKKSISKRKHSDTGSNDNNKPKRPVTAYIFFAKKMRPLIQAKSPEMSGLDITKQIAYLWSTTNEKEPFTKLEADSRNRYFKEMKKWRGDTASSDGSSLPELKRRAGNVGTDPRSEGNGEPNSSLLEKPQQKNTDPPVHILDGTGHGQRRPNPALEQRSDQHHTMGYPHERALQPSYVHSNQYLMGPGHMPPFQYGPGGPPMGNPPNMTYPHGPNSHHLNNSYYNGHLGPGPSHNFQHQHPR